MHWKNDRAHLAFFRKKRRFQGIATYAALNNKIAITGVKFVPPMLIRWIFGNACPQYVSRMAGAPIDTPPKNYLLSGLLCPSNKISDGTFTQIVTRSSAPLS
jgi:hypothetical protein